MNHPITFELAKLLFEKDINIKSSHWYNMNQTLIAKFVSPDNTESITLNDILNHTVTVNHYKAPTISDVIMWLYKTHNIWITVEYFDDVLNFCYTITTIIDNTEQNEKNNFKTPSEAYESAIKYLLNNLLQHGTNNVNKTNNK